ncbi:unannotated protein [freshwater metagenome]|uniref:Unannotated protein n=1 Tax=freshwater metagenome TaxID=449393 RepID=A0A6J7URI4_9ZZZZ
MGEFVHEHGAKEQKAGEETDERSGNATDVEADQCDDHGGTPVCVHRNAPDRQDPRTAKHDGFLALNGAHR